MNLDKQKNAYEEVKEFQEELKVQAFEFVFSRDTSQVIDRFAQIKENGSRVWVNSLWESLNAGPEDNLAVQN